MSYGTTKFATSAQDESASQPPSATGTSRESEENEAAQTSTVQLRQSFKNFYDRNFGLFLVFLAQTCGSIMNTAAKLLATNYEENFHSLQIIFIRMSCTTVLGCLYMWYNQIPDFPLGQKGVRKLLVLRGVAGFVGLFGLYYSLTWLEIADATVITFIIPTMTALVCFIWLREPFTSKEAFAGLIAFCGVLFVARPPWLFPDASGDSAPGKLDAPLGDVTSTLTLAIPDTPSGGRASTPISATQRTMAILIAILGALGAAMAYATIRVIGKRSHSLISVNYFAVIATMGSAIIILVHPDLHFVIPHGLDQWGLIAIIGFTGFLLQFLLTEGLQREKAGRATNLTYLQLVFALVVERVIWGTTPPIESFIGAVLIIGAAIWVTLQKNAPIADQKKKVVDEESSLLRNSAEQ